MSPGEKERHGREPATIRVWFRVKVRVRVIWHYVPWYFVRIPVSDIVKVQCWAADKR